MDAAILVYYSASSTLLFYHY